MLGRKAQRLTDRAQAARVLARFPKFRELVANREATVTTLAMVAPRLTAANAAIFLEGIRGKSVTEVRKLVGATDFHGKSLVAKARCEMDSLWERALEVARHSGRAMSREALLKEALGFWLEEWDIPSLKKEACTHPSRCPSLKKGSKASRGVTRQAGAPRRRQGAAPRAPLGVQPPHRPADSFSPM